MKIMLGIKVLLVNVGLGDLDWVIICENFEGEYFGVGGCVYCGFLEEVVIEVVIYICVGVEWIMCFVFEMVYLCLCKFLIVVIKLNV